MFAAAVVVPASVLTTPEGQPGLSADYSSGGTEGDASTGGIAAAGAKPGLLVSRIEPVVDLDEKDLPQQIKGKPSFAVHWTGFLNPNETGDYLLGIKAAGFARVSLNNKRVVQIVRDNRRLTRAAPDVHGALQSHLRFIRQKLIERRESSGRRRPNRRPQAW